MKEFIEYIVTQIATVPDSVVVNMVEEEDQTVARITVAQEDMGLIIGKEGRTIKSIRALAKAKAIKEDMRINVELEDPYRDEAPASAPAEEADVEDFDLDAELAS